jgi:hypothetical protein
MSANINSASTAASHQLQVPRPVHCLETEVYHTVCEFLSNPRDIVCFLVANNVYKGMSLEDRKNNLRFYITRHFNTTKTLPTGREMRLYRRILAPTHAIGPKVFTNCPNSGSREVAHTLSAWVNTEFPKLRFNYSEGASGATLRITYFDHLFYVFDPFDPSGRNIVPVSNDHLTLQVLKIALWNLRTLPTISLCAQNSPGSALIEVGRITNGQIFPSTFAAYTLALAPLRNNKPSEADLSRSLETCFTRNRPEANWLVYADSLMKMGAVPDLNRILNLIMNTHLFDFDTMAINSLNWWVEKEAAAPLLRTSPQVIENMLATVYRSLNPPVSTIVDPRGAVQLGHRKFDSRVADVLRAVVNAGGQITSTSVTQHAIELLFPKTLEILLDRYSQGKNLASSRTASEITAFLKGSDRSSPDRWAFGKLIHAIVERLKREFATADRQKAPVLYAEAIRDTLTSEILQMLECLHRHGAVLDKNDPFVARAFNQVADYPKYTWEMELGIPRWNEHSRADKQKIAALYLATTRSVFEWIDHTLTRLTTERPATTAAAAATPTKNKE